MRRSVELWVDFAHDLPAVEGDPAQLRQVIMNLIINAAESFSEDHPGTVRISTGLREMHAAELDRP